MALKKNDKLIAIIGVAILVIAGIGIFIYAGQEEKEPTVEEESQVTTFNIYSDELNGVAEPLTEYPIKAKLIGTRTVSQDFTVSGKNLKSAEFFIEFHDNKAGFLFGRILRSIGADAITLNVLDSTGASLGKDSIKGDGNTTVAIDVGAMIPDLTIDAKDLNEANMLLAEKDQDYDLIYTVEVSLKSGIWGRLREMLGKDTFSLEIRYTYYSYYLEPQGEYDDNIPDVPDTDGDATTDYSHLFNTGFH